jgi:hypothetical protein
MWLVRLHNQEAFDYYLALRETPSGSAILVSASSNRLDLCSNGDVVQVGLWGLTRTDCENGQSVELAWSDSGLIPHDRYLAHAIAVGSSQVASVMEHNGVLVVATLVSIHEVRLFNDWAMQKAEFERHASRLQWLLVEIDIHGRRTRRIGYHNAATGARWHLGEGLIWSVDSESITVLDFRSGGVIASHSIEQETLECEGGFMETLSSEGMLIRACQSPQHHRQYDLVSYGLV